MAQIEIKKHGETSYKVLNDTWYSIETTDEMVRLLEDRRQMRTRLRFRFGDVETGRDWLEEWDVEGTIGRSMGPVKIPLLIHNSRSHGGGGILTHCIVRLLSTGKNPTVYYSHPKYNRPMLTQHISDMEGYDAEVHADGKVHARFKKVWQANKWIEKMSR